jgi:hypothetical protein
MRTWAIVSWVGVAALAGGLAVAIAQRDPRAMLYLSLHLAGALGCVLAWRRPNPLTAAFVFAMDFNGPGWAWHWLDVLWHYDKFAHVFVTLAVTPHLALFLLRPLRKELLAYRFILAVVVISLGASVNVLWETYEWICDHFVVPPGTMSLSDTMMDLVSDCVGATLSVPLAIYALRLERPETKRPAPPESRPARRAEAREGV